jgi:hypothetical protein
MQIVGTVVTLEGARHEQNSGTVATPLSVTAVTLPPFSQSARKGWGTLVLYPDLRLAILILAIEVEGGGLEIATQIELEAVVRPPGA